MAQAAVYRPCKLGPLGGSCRAAERCPQNPPLYDLPRLRIRSNGDNKWPSPELVGRADHPPRVVPARAPGVRLAWTSSGSCERWMGQNDRDDPKSADGR